MIFFVFKKNQLLKLYLILKKNVFKKLDYVKILNNYFICLKSFV